MSSFIDFEAKTVETAIQQACKELNITRDELKYDIISHGSTGIFGLVGTKKALIRVKVAEHKNAPVHPPEPDAAGTGPVPEKAEPESETDVSALVDEAFGPIEDPPAAAPPAKQIKSINYDEIVDFVTPLLHHVVRLISPDSQISVHAGETEGLRFSIEGGDSARLIGKRGQTLDAIQYLIDKVVNKTFGPDAQVDIDVEGYLEKRKSELIALASRLAQKAQQTGKPMIINRISAHDRRVIHLTLKDNRKVRTQSVGDGDFRKLLILPKKKAAAKKDKKKT